MDKSKNATPEMILASWSMGFTEFFLPETVIRLHFVDFHPEPELSKAEKFCWIRKNQMNRYIPRKPFSEIDMSQTYVCLNLSSLVFFSESAKETLFIVSFEYVEKLFEDLIVPKIMDFFS